jgi:hypothetical protein
VSLVLVTYALSAVATGLAWAVAWQRAEHRPIALLLTGGLAFDLARRALSLLALAPGHALVGAGPLHGWYRVAGHTHAAIFLAWPAALAGASLRVFLRRQAWPIAFVWGVTCVGMAASYPLTRGAVLARVYTAAELAAIMVGVGAVAMWVPRREAPEPAHIALALVFVAEIVALVAGPWRFNLFGAWPLAQLAYASIFSVLVVFQGGWLWFRTSSHAP